MLLPTNVSLLILIAPTGKHGTAQSVNVKYPIQKKKTQKKRYAMTTITTALAPLLAMFVALALVKLHHVPVHQMTIVLVAKLAILILVSVKSLILPAPAGKHGIAQSANVNAMLLALAVIL